MITPTKGIAPERSLLAVGAQILQVLDRPLTVSQALAALRRWRADHDHFAPISFNWFVLALDVLFALDLVDTRDDLLVVRRVDAPSSQRQRSTI